MPGIFGTNIDNEKSVMEQENRIYKQVKSNKWFLELSSIRKFENDKTLYENDKYTVLIDGVILNLISLKQKYQTEKLEELAINMYEKFGEKFFSYFRGNFCGFFEDKVNKRTYIFTNHTGDKTIFYYCKGNNIIFGSEVKHIVSFMKQNKIEYNLDEAGAYSLITYGYMYDNVTPIKEIKRLLPGCYIRIEEGFEELEYYKVSNKVKETKKTEEEIMENIEIKFKQAVKLQLDKNKEYGYDDYAPLSAGLDARMTNYMIRKITDKPIYNITYSQSDQLDEKIPAKMAADLRNHWLFKSLDNGLALYEIDKSLQFTDGIIYYAWPSQLYDYMKLINIQNLGIVHTGVIGDVIIGTFFKDIKKNNYEIGDGAYSKKLVNKLKEMVKEKEYDNYEIGMFYNRAFNGAVLGYSTTFQYYTEAMSPFMNVEFMEYCLSLPLEYRIGHNIYYKWVRKYHPEAAKYTHNGVKIPKMNSLRITLKGKKYTIGRILYMLKRIIKQKTNKSCDMNPIQYWYETNLNLRQYMDKYYNEYIYTLDNHKSLQQDIIRLYKDGTAMEKIQVITVLSFMKKFFMERLNENEI